MAGSLQAVGSEQRIVFKASLPADIKPLLGPAVDVWAFGILLNGFPMPFSLGSHPFFSTCPEEVKQSWHVVSSSVRVWCSSGGADSQSPPARGGATVGLRSDALGVSPLVSLPPA